MTKKNPLYYFLLDEIDEKGPIFRANVIKTKNSTEPGQQDSVYALIILPKTTGQNIELGTKKYSVSLHHISIYADYQAYSKNSDYHYTALLKDENAVAHELHIYFDKRGLLIGTPNLKAINSKTQEKTSLALQQDEHNVLVDLANSFSATLMANLRQLHQEKRDQFNQSADQLLTEADAAQSLDEVHNILEKVKKFTERAKNINPELETILNNTQDKLEWMMIDLLDQSPAVISDEPVAHDSQPELPKIQTVKMQRPQPKKLKPTKEDPVLLNEITNLLANANQTQNLSVSDAIELNKKSKNILLQLLDLPFSSIWTNKIYRLTLQRNDICIKLLSEALDNKNLDLITQLKDFIPALPDTSLIALVKANQLDELKLLLEHGAFSIDQIHTEEEGKPISLLEWTYKHNKPECFKLLLKHGASSLIAIEKGIPLAHLIIDEKKPGFYDELMAHYSQKECVNLMKQLAAIMQTIDASASKKYRISAQTTQELPKLLFSSERNKTLAQKQQELPQQDRHNIQNLIDESPRLTQLKKEILTANTKYLKSLTSQQQLSCAKSFDEIFTNCKDKIIFPSNPTEETLTDLFEELLSKYYERSRIIELNNEIQLMAKKSKNAMKGNKAKKVQQEYQKKVAEYNKLQTEFNKNNMGLELTEPAKQLMNVLEQMVDNINGLKSLSMETVLNGFSQESLDLVGAGVLAALERSLQTNDRASSSSAGNNNSIFSSSVKGPLNNNDDDLQYNNNNNNRQ